LLPVEITEAPTTVAHFFTFSSVSTSRRMDLDDDFSALWRDATPA
jgi:hypothetical protein